MPESTDVQLSLRDQASDILRRAATVQSRLDELEQTHQRERDHLQREIEKNDLWLEHESSSDRRELAFLIANAEAIARERLLYLEHGGKKELSTPHGTISAVAAKPKVEITDPEALFVWAFERRDLGYVREPKPTPPMTDWGSIRKAGAVIGDQLIVDGEPVPGVTVTPVDPNAPDKLTVEVWT